jgi:hypothetical protein
VQTLVESQEAESAQHFVESVVDVSTDFSPPQDTKRADTANITNNFFMT